MSYNVNKLATAADCDNAIASATARKSKMQLEKSIGELAMANQATALAHSNASLITVKAEILGAEAAIAELPEGKDKETHVSKLRRLNDRKDNLEDRLKKGGSVDLLETELDNTLLGLQIAELDNYLAAITARKTAL
jgi:hypothetical protein